MRISHSDQDRAREYTRGYNIMSHSMLVRNGLFALSRRTTVPGSCSCHHFRSISSSLRVQASDSGPDLGGDKLPAHSKSSHSHLTAQEEAAKRLEETDTKPPPYLSRALGIRERPTKGKISREEWRANLLSKEKRVQERRHL